MQNHTTSDGEEYATDRERCVPCRCESRRRFEHSVDTDDFVSVFDRIFEYLYDLLQTAVEEKNRPYAIAT